MNKYIIIALLCLGELVACSGTKDINKKPQLTLTPQKLDLFVNQKTDPYTILVKYILNIPGHTVPACTRMIYTPHFVAPGHDYALTPLIVTGKKFERRAKRLQQMLPDDPNALRLTSDGKDMKVRLSQTIPFELWMPQSKLMATVTVENCNGRTRQYEMTLANGVFYMPLGPGPVRVKYVKKEVEQPMEKTIRFEYASGQATFDRNYDGNGPRMQEMMKLIDSLQNDPQLQLKKIIITGSGSPTGNLTVNRRLAEKRAQLMKDRLTERRHIDASLIETRSIPEDWERLRQLIETSDMTDKYMLLRIWDQAESDAQREALLKKSPQYQELSRTLFPKLRQVSCEFQYTRKTLETVPVPE